MAGGWAEELEDSATTPFRSGERPIVAAARRSSPSLSTFPTTLGRYLVSEAFAQGGMASLHLAVVDGAPGRAFAMKKLHKHLASDDYFTKMLLDEAAIAARIRHRNVVGVFGAEVIEHQLVLVMEYVEGISLANLMRESLPKALPLRVAVSIMAGVLRGLHAAHECRDDNGQSLGVVHRDVSPQNVLVGVDGVARVLDFGIAKAARRLQTTRSGEVKGKLAYMSPEQLKGAEVDRRSDVWAASVVLWEALTASPLFHAESEGMTVGMVLEGARERPGQLVDGIPAALDAVVMRGLAVDRKDRFNTALDMALALEKVFASPSGPTEVALWVQTLGRDELSERSRAQLDLSRRTAAAGSVPPPPESGRRVRRHPSVPPETANSSACVALQARTEVLAAPATRGAVETRDHLKLIMLGVFFLVMALANVASCRSASQTLDARAPTSTTHG